MPLKRRTAFAQAFVCLDHLFVWPWYSSVYKYFPHLNIYPRPCCIICFVVIHRQDITTPIKAPSRFLRGTLNNHSRALSPQCKLRPSVNLVLNRCWPCLTRVVHVYVIRYMLVSVCSQSKESIERESKWKCDQIWAILSDATLNRTAKH